MLTNFSANVKFAKQYECATYLLKLRFVFTSLISRCDAQTWFAPKSSNRDEYQWDSRLFDGGISCFVQICQYFQLQKCSTNKIQNFARAAKSRVYILPR